MNKPKFETTDLTAENVAKIAELFLVAISEGRINFNMLRILLGYEVFGDEACEFTWAGKREVGKPIRKTLRPCPEESKDRDTTENLYIEGDNLDVLKLLQESYLGKVKMIYIDPPYNTGHDFIYHDDFHSDDDDGNRQFHENTTSNPRMHSHWCSMMYPRLVLARNLLRNDGIIFISIDDNEVAQLRKIGDEVFGESNFVAQLVWERAYSPKNDTKSLIGFTIGRLPRTVEANARYSNLDNDPRGVWKPSDMSVKTYNAECDYPITLPSGRVVETPTGRCWSLSKNAFLDRLQDNRIYFGADSNSVPQIKYFLTELKFDGMAPQSIMFYKDVGHSQEGAEAAKAGYSNICEIGKERIRRAGDKIKADAGLMTQDLDIGFRVLKLDDSNMKDVYYAAGEYTQNMLSQMESNIKDNRNDMDLLFGCLLDWGLPLSMPYTQEQIDGVTVHTYNDGDLIACFADSISESVVREIARRQPLRVVFRDSSFTDSPSKINVGEIFSLLALTTNVKVI